MAKQSHLMHGSESFFIEGEGLVDTQLGGRAGNAPDAVTASDTPLASKPQALAEATPPPFRFSRCGPKGTPLPVSATRKLARAMTAAGGPAGTIPSGYTYLGQFLDHDLTMDKTTVMLGTEVSPADMLQGRSPLLDLDSLYGAGPADPASAKFYESDGVHLKTGTTIAIGPDKAAIGHDLPRVGTGNAAARRTALIPDPRNDENLVVASTHLAMIHFHNRCVNKLAASVPAAQRFATARRRVTLHYQWMVLHDFLPRIIDHAVLADVLAHGRKVVQPSAAPLSVPTMPVEFSVACYRLGHSMVRAEYNWNRRFPGVDGALEYLFEFSGLGGDLGGEPRLLSNWIVDWRRMYDFPAGGRPRNKAPLGVNHAMRLDTLLTDPLKNLPPSTFGGPASIPFDDLRRNLAFRNLTRANMVSLASGQQMVAKLKASGVAVKALTAAQITDGNGGAKLTALTAAERSAVVSRTPLWFYVLREAELNNGRYAGVGARIIAETFHRCIEASRFSVIRDPAFRPNIGRANNTFEMTDLLFFAFAGKAVGLNPLG